MNPFDLSNEQLLAIGTEIHGPSIHHCHLEEINPIRKGGCGDKFVADLIATTAAGQEIRTPVFLKKFSWKGKSEAAHYRHLAESAVPTPRLYGAIVHPDGDEILFLERLTQIGFDRQSETEWRHLLALLARLNACNVTSDYLPHLHPFEQGGRIDGWWITGFNNPFPPSAEEIENTLRACGTAANDLPILCQAARQLFARVDALPKGLIHQDFLADNLGWRGDRAEMVIFDVHKNTLGPRFADVGAYLGLPDWSNTAAFLDQLPTLRDALVDHYLEEYARSGGGSVSRETFEEETALLFWAHKVAILWWMAEQQDTERIGQVLDYLRTWSG